MSAGLNQIRFPVDGLESLSGGRAADCWCRELARKTRWLTATMNSCHWLDDLVDIDLRLSKCPLFGSGLTALANRAPANSAAADSASRTFNNQPANESQHHLAKTPPAIARDAFEVSSKDTESQGASKSKAASSSSLTEQVLQLQPQADISLLRRHGGENHSPANVENQTGKPKLMPTSDRSRVPQDLRWEATPKALLARAARRAERVWFLATHERHDSDRSPTGTQTRSSNSLSFAEDWSKTLTGVRASSALLMVLANSGSALDRSFRNSENGERSPRSAAANQTRTALDRSFWAMENGEPNSRSDGANQTTPALDPSFRVAESGERNPGFTAANHTPAARGSNPHFFEPALRGSSSAPTHYGEVQRLPGGVQWPLDPTPESSPLTGVESPSHDHVDSSSFLSSPSWRRPVAGTEDWAAENRIAPPTVTPSPVALRPPESANVPALPVASVTAQLGAKVEEAMAQGDDLTLLASKIERLLNQEARRHGIDV